MSSASSDTMSGSYSGSSSHSTRHASGSLSSSSFSSTTHKYSGALSNTSGAVALDSAASGYESGPSDGSYTEVSVHEDKAPPTRAAGVDPENWTSHTFSLGISDITVHPTPPSGTCGRAPQDPDTDPVLDGVSYTVQAGHLVMLLGPSGSGKSVLLDALAGRLSPGLTRTAGAVLLNGHRASPQDVRAVSGYVEQDDILAPMDTPRANLGMLARLLLPRDATPEERAARVAAILHRLGISHVADTLVGVPGLLRGLSGGERRRAHIAQSLINSPAILFVDEPTAGLDASSARGVVDMLRSLAHEQGIAVLSTISQPSPEIWSLFDDVLCLTGGRVAFAGPRADVVPFLEKQGHVFPYDMTACEFVIDVLQSSGDAAADAFAQDASASTSQSPEHSWEGGSAEEEVAAWLVPLPRFPARLTELVKRNLRMTRRNSSATWARCAQLVIFAVLLSMLYFAMPRNQGGVRDRQGLVLMLSILAFFSGAESSMHLILAERHVFLRERAVGAYGVLEYVLAKVLLDVPMQTVMSLLLSVPVYFATGFQVEADRVWIFLGFMILLMISGSWMGLAISALAGEPEAIAAGLTAVLMPMLLLSGLLLRIENIPVFLAWARHFSVFKYGTNGILVNELRGMTFSCDPSVAVNGTCPIATGEQVIDYLDADRDGGIGFDFAMLLVSLFVCLLLMVYALFSISKQRKR